MSIRATNRCYFQRECSLLALYVHCEHPVTVIFLKFTFPLSSNHSDTNYYNGRPEISLKVLTDSVSTLLGRPVHQSVNANIYSANHMAASQCVKGCRHGQLFFRPNVIMEKKCDLSDFNCGKN